MSRSGLSTALSAGLFLIDSTKTHNEQVKPSDLKAILVTRLSQYYTHLDLQDAPDSSQTLEQLQVTTAKEALSIVEKVQHIIGTDGSPSEVPAIGTRDLAELRTLTSIVFKWGVDPLLNRVISSWPSKPKPDSRIRSKIIDLTTAPEDYQLLSSLLSGVMALLFPHGLQGPIPQTLITATILNRHVADLLRPCLALGWLPKSLASESTPTLDAVRPMAMRLLAILPPSQTIAALGAVLSSASPNPPHVQKSCASLLSRQLLRPEGVTGLCAAVFGEEASTDDAPLEKLEHVARVLTAVPATMKPDEYFGAIIPRIVGLLSDNAPPSHKRAAAFAISRMLTTDGTFSSHALVANILLPILHSPFLHITPPEPNPDASPDLTPEAALSTLTTLITNTDPSPTLISTLLSPITSALYSLLSHLDHAKTSDPALKESLKGLLTTWGRVSNAKEGINILWAILDGEGGDWKVGIGGDIRRIDESEKPPALSFLTPEDLRRADEAEELLDNNFLDLRPDPVHFVRFLKSIDRSDMSSELFVRLLETYRERKSRQENDPMRTLLYLQIIIQIQTQLSGSDASSNILSKPEHILSFVKHALDAANAPAPEVDKSSLGRHPRSSSGLRMEDLRLVSEDEDISDEGDSDDDTPGEELTSADDEMTETAINLLLSLLEAHEDLSARTAPILNDIFSLLEPLTNDSAPSIRPLAREARMVMTARLASTSSAARKKSRLSNDEEDPQEVYQKALKLLQDPILPVRAHGLLLLRQLVTPTPRTSTNAEPRVTLDAALVPAILSIFLQSVQDDDSYMFLNAVQGLAAMVDTFGKDVLKGLVNSYTKGLDGLGETSLLTQQDMDTRIRIGEALGQVIRKCGSALGIYVDILVPPLFNVVRSPHVPTTLRTSSLSLLADCEGTHALSLLRYTADLSDAMIDLLQVESITATASKEQASMPTPTLDDQPTTTNSKLPPLRRAAIHLLALLIREAISEVYESESTSTSIFPSELMKRARTTLAYISSTDEDAVVRVMAREAKEELDHLGQAMMGL